jgi:hypothetical protein
VADRPRTTLWRRSFGCGGCLVAIAVGFVALVVVIAPSGDRDGPAPAGPMPVLAPPAPAPPTPTPALSIAVGEEGVLERPGVEGVWMTDSLDSYRALVEAERKIEGADIDVQVKGKMARVALGLAKRIKIVRNGARVRVLGTNSGGLYVVTLDGEDEGRSGWVHSWCVKPAPKPPPAPGQEEDARRTGEEARIVAERERIAEVTRRHAEAKAQRHAATLLRAAQDLEEAGKTRGALDTYRRIIEGFPDTPQAKAAAARVAAMGGE